MGAAWSRYPDLREVSSPEARRIAEAVRKPWARGGPRMRAVREFSLESAEPLVRVRLYEPSAGEERPALVYLHGGGWTLFSLDTHDRLMREVAARAGVVVVGVDYALAPEAKYPIALNQVSVVLQHLADRGGRLGIDPDRLAIGGDSAGANLAVAASLKLLTEDKAGRIRALLLNYGVFDRRSTKVAERRYGGPGNMLTIDEMEAFWANYLNDELESTDPLVCPLHADLRGLPPARLVVAECDLLAEQSAEMADRLRKAGVPVAFEVYAGACHSFLEAVSIATIAQRALDDSAAWLRTSLAVK